MVKKNTIPRKFTRIVGKMLIETNVNEANDIFHVSKDDTRYIGYNTRTKEDDTFFVSMLRNGEVFEIIEYTVKPLYLYMGI